MLTVLTNRLARVVDRARALEQKESKTHESARCMCSAARSSTLAQRGAIC
jgi:hypothetical protein